MDLRTFVAETLAQIVDGVAEAQSRLAQGATNARLNPATRDAGSQLYGDPQPVEFDVAVTVATQSDDLSADKIGAKAGLLSVVSLGASAESGTQSHETTRNEAISRVKFVVSLAQPATIETVSIPPRHDHDPYDRI